MCLQRASWVVVVRWREGPPPPQGSISPAQGGGVWGVGACQWVVVVVVVACCVACPPPHPLGPCHPTTAALVEQQQQQQQRQQHWQAAVGGVRPSPCSTASLPPRSRPWVPAAPGHCLTAREASPWAPPLRHHPALCLPEGESAEREGERERERERV